MSVPDDNPTTREGIELWVAISSMTRSCPEMGPCRVGPVIVRSSRLLIRAEFSLGVNGEAGVLSTPPLWRIWVGRAESPFNKIYSARVVRALLGRSRRQS